MSITLDATLSGESSNTYLASVAEADAYVAEIALIPGLGVDTSAWLTMGSPSDAPKKRMMTLAAQSIDTQRIDGNPVSPTQALAFPRLNLRNRPLNSIIPDPVKLAQAIECCMLANPQTATKKAREAGLVTDTAGDVSRTYDLTAATGNISRTLSSPAVEVLRRANLLAGTVSTVPVFRS